MTNLEFSKNKLFKQACKAAGIEPTQRQASKFRNGKGLARKNANLIKCLQAVNQAKINKMFNEDG